MRGKWHLEDFELCNNSFTRFVINRFVKCHNMKCSGIGRIHAKPGFSLHSTHLSSVIFTRITTVDGKAKAFFNRCDAQMLSCLICEREFLRNQCRY